MKRNNQFFSAVLIIFYFTIILILDLLYSAVYNDIYSTMYTYKNFYVLHSLLLNFIIFLKWFSLGVLMSFLQFDKRPQFIVNKFDLFISLIAITLFILTTIGKLTFIPYYGKPVNENQFYISFAIFSGFFLIKGLFSEDE